MMSKRLAPAFVWLALLCSPVLAAEELRSVQESLTKAIACFPDAWNRQDMTAFGQCFTGDADFVNVTGQWWKGRSSIERNHAFLLGTIEQSDTDGITIPAKTYGVFKGTTLGFLSNDLRLLRPGVVIARVSWQITGDARTPQSRNGLLMLVLTVTDGVWKIAGVQNTEIQRPIK
jgi:hypothetical protein